MMMTTSLSLYSLGIKVLVKVNGSNHRALADLLHTGNGLVVRHLERSLQEGEVKANSLKRWECCLYAGQMKLRNNITLLACPWGLHSHEASSFSHGASTDWEQSAAPLVHAVRGCIHSQSPRTPMLVASLLAACRNSVWGREPICVDQNDDACPLRYAIIGLADGSTEHFV